MYQKLGEDVPAACREPGYKDEMIRAYPFHPELISVLYERWGTIPEFQRTRGVLRLLADVISDLYQSKDNEALIQSGSINLGQSSVRGELVKHTGAGSAYVSVIDSDIAGDHAKAPEIDRQLGSEYAKESVSEKLARAIFMYSFSGGQQRGATLPQLRLAVLNPEMAPPFVSDALDRITKRLWYLYHDNGLYRFDSRPNLNRILVDREELIRSEPEKVRDFAKSTLNDLIGDAAFRVYRYPAEDRDVADEPRLSLVVLDLHQTASEDGLPKDTEEFVGRILKQHGKGFRKHANVLMFLAPDTQRASEVIDAARRLLALRSIDEHKTTKSKLSDEQLKDLAGRLKEAEARLPSALMNAYRHVLVPAEKKTIRCFDMGIAVGEGDVEPTGAREAQGRADPRQARPQDPDRRTVRALARRSRGRQRPHPGRLLHAAHPPADVAGRERAPRVPRLGRPAWPLRLRPRRRREEGVRHDPVQRQDGDRRRNARSPSRPGCSAPPWRSRCSPSQDQM